MPVPIITNGQVDFHYTVSSLEHTTQLRVSLNNPSGPAPYNLDTFAGGTLLWTDWVDLVVTAIKADYPSSITIDRAVLQRYVDPDYIELDSYSIGVAGTSGSAVVLGEQGTFSFKDVYNNTCKLTLLETANGVPVHQAYGALGVANALIVDGILDRTATGIGQCLLSKSGQPYNRFIYFTSGLNKKLLRRRNLA